MQIMQQQYEIRPVHICSIIVLQILQQKLNHCVQRGHSIVRNAVGGVSFPGKKRYEGVRFNVISITRGWVGVKFPGKKRYVTLEWPQNRN